MTQIEYMPTVDESVDAPAAWNGDRLEQIADVLSIVSDDNDDTFVQKTVVDLAILFCESSREIPIRELTRGQRERVRECLCGVSSMLSQRMSGKPHADFARSIESQAVVIRARLGIVEFCMDAKTESAPMDASAPQFAAPRRDRKQFRSPKH